MRQKSIEIEGLAHSVPIPLGCRVGPILATSGIGGKDPKTGRMPPDAPDTRSSCRFAAAC